MSSLQKYKRAFFIGIGGIGMSALARYFRHTGWEVAGYDKTPSPLTERLESEGMTIHFEDDLSLIPAIFLQKEDTLIVYTPAVPKGHKELNYFQDNGFALHKRAEVLAWLTEGKTTIAVAGTHGKTSTASIISHLLRTADVPFYALLGGIAANYDTNFLAPEKGEANLIVVEADEYDRSFLRLHPDVAVITAIEPDHLDIYGTFENLQEAYHTFAAQVKPTGKLLIVDNFKNIPEILGELIPYSAEKEIDYSAYNIRVEKNSFYFDASIGEIMLEGLHCGVPGRHNIENCIAAMGAVKDFITDTGVYYKALESFKGVRRRFEVICRTEEYIYVDDYAHHPTEIEVTINTVRELYPDRKITGIFQPHLFSRTKDLAAEFARSLSLLDEVYLLPIYPARELPMPGVTTELIYNQLTSKEKHLVNREELLERLKANPPSVLITIGAGDIDRLVGPIKEIIESKKGGAHVE